MADHAETKTAEIPSSAAKPSGTAPVPAAKPPSKPGAEKAGAEIQPDRMRRRVIWAAIGGYLGINFLMFLRFFFPRALYEPNTIFTIGYPADFALGIDQRFLMTNRVWVIREPDRIFVIFARCTHLGCTPEWKPAKTSSSARATAAVMTAKASTSRGPRRVPWTARTSNSTPPAKLSWIPAGCTWTIRAPASISSTIQARILSRYRTGFAG